LGLFELKRGGLKIAYGFKHPHGTPGNFLNISSMDKKERRRRRRARK
jgi:hypothetical protein